MQDRPKAGMGRPRQFDRDEALRRAMSLFREYGYEATSLTQLREAMGGISAASLYAAFGSKEELFREAIDLYLAGNRVRDALSDPEMSPADAIRRALELSIGEYASHSRPDGCMVVLSAINCSPQNEHIRAAMERERERTRLAFQDCLQRGVTSGTVNPRADVAALRDYFSTILNGLSIQARDGMSRAELHGIIDLAVSALGAEPQSG